MQYFVLHVTCDYVSDKFGFFCAAHHGDLEFSTFILALTVDQFADDNSTPLQTLSFKSGGISNHKGVTWKHLFFFHRNIFQFRFVIPAYPIIYSGVIFHQNYVDVCETVKLLVKLKQKECSAIFILFVFLLRH